MRVQISIVLALCLLLPLAAGAQSYQYDTAGRLTRATYVDGSFIGYEYDANSNITRIRYSPLAASTEPPNGVIDTPAGDVSIETGESVSFTGTGSDPDGEIPLTYLWEFDGAVSDSTVEDPGPVTFPAAGTYTVTFTVTDAGGVSDPTPDTVLVTVTEPARPPASPDGGNGGSGGGGSVFLLPLLLALVALRRLGRPLLLVMLLAAGSAQAQSWNEMNSGTDENLNDVWMASPTLAYAVGDNGTVLRFDGSAWSAVDVGTSMRLNSVWGTGPDDVWIVGASGTVLNFDGTVWNTVDIGAGTLPLNDVWTSGPGEIVYIVGARGAWRFENGSWTRISVKVSNTSATLEPAFNLSSIRGTANFVVMTANSDNGLNPGLFANFDWVGLSTFDLDSVWIFDNTFMVAVGASPKLMDGGNPEGRSSADWQDFNVGVPAKDVWGVDPSSIWAVGGDPTFGRVTFFDGNADNNWDPQLTLSFRPLSAIHGIDRENLITVGSLGTIYGAFAEPPKPSASNFIFSVTDAGGVNTFTGEKTHRETDFVLPGELPVVFQRGLSKQGGLDEPMGDNWSHSFNWHASGDAGGGSVRVLDPWGVEYLYEDTGAGLTQASPGWANTGLIQTTGEWIQYDRETGLLRTFDVVTGRFLALEDRNGNRLDMNYSDGKLSDVSDGAGELIRFGYNASDLLTSASVVRDTTLTRGYSYDGSNQLTGTTSPRNTVTEYAYDPRGNLTRVTYGAGTADSTTPRTWEYDSLNRVSASTLMNGGRREYRYINDQTVVQQPDGAEQIYDYDPGGRLLRSTSPLGNMTNYSYDTLGRRVERIDPLGRSWQWGYGSDHGRLERFVKPDGLTTNYTYTGTTGPGGATFHDLIQVDRSDGTVVKFEHDSNGNPVSFKDEEGSETKFAYDSRGNITAVTNASGGVTTYTHTSRNLPASRTDPNGNTVSYGYDGWERLVSLTDSVGTTVIDYSNRGTPDRIISRSGAVINVEYDALDRVRELSRSDGEFVMRNYDEAGNLVSETKSGLLTTTHTYDDQGNPQSATHNGAHTNTFAYDADNRLEEIRDPDNREWRFEHDEADELTAVVWPDDSRMSIERGDPRGLITDITLGDDSYEVTHDENGRPVSIADSAGREVTIARDLRGDWREVTHQPSGTRRTYETDALGNLKSYTNPLGGVHRRDFGDDGRLDTEIDAADNTTRLTRDQDNRVVRKEYDDGLAIDVTYGDGRLPRNFTGSDGTSYELNSTDEGLIVGGTDLALSRTLTRKVDKTNGIEVTYDDSDRARRMTFALGVYIEYEYNGRGDVVGITDSFGGFTSITPTEVGKIGSMTTPDGRTTTITYDRAARVIGIDISNIGSITVNRGIFGRIESVDRDLPIPRDLPEADRRFEYDAASRKESGAYDARGNLVSEGDTALRYDALNRLVESDDGTQSRLFDYDVLGQLTRVTRGTAERVFVQNYSLPRPRVSIERDGAGNDIWYYVHNIDDGRLIYRFNAAGERQYYHFDENGNTTLLTDGNGDVLNAYNTAPHGEVFARTEKVANDLTTAAEFGGRELDDQGTLMIGDKVVDSFSGHFLTDGRYTGLFGGIIFSDTGLNEQGGRSVTPGNVKRSDVTDFSSGDFGTLTFSNTEEDGFVRRHDLNTGESTVRRRAAGGDLLYGFLASAPRGPVSRRLSPVDLETEVGFGLRNCFISGDRFASSNSLSEAERCFLTPTHTIPIERPMSVRMAARTVAQAAILVRAFGAEGPANRFNRLFDDLFAYRLGKSVIGGSMAVPSDGFNFSLRYNPNFSSVDLFKLDQGQRQLEQPAPPVDSILKEVPKSLVIL